MQCGNAVFAAVMHKLANGCRNSLIAVLTLLKLLALPALVLAVAHWGFGLSGLPLSVLVMMAALPVGSNALIFAQRYQTLQAEATAAPRWITGPRQAMSAQNVRIDIAIASQIPQRRHRQRPT